MLMEREEIDIHPYGRGGIYEGILYTRKEEEPVDMLGLVVWFIFFGSLVMMAVSIIFVAELTYFLHAEPTPETRKAFCDFFKHCRYPPLLEGNS
ncbi:hypothetical protein CSKR_201737 [Clonorchis sinensis]|uniref:Uncharacterized protein n=1 Tax=Clonorchis sinensis TaxID=79923 RepID=A0A8T1MUL3_CLOSI|nr:hypothetical protein CSKR_201737 [Clonorchis sinensis]